MKTLILASLLILVSCGSAKNSSTTKEDPRPKALIIGDSISIGYTPEMKSQFPELNVTRIEGNAQNSRNGKSKIKSWVSTSTPWTFCTINHGIWDVVVVNHQITLNEYISNLRYEVEFLKQNCEVVVFANTTRVPENHERVFTAPNIGIYNQAAEDLMTELNVPVCDLNAVSETITHLHTNAAEQNNVHYTDEGSKVLGEALADCVRNNL